VTRDGRDRQRGAGRWGGTLTRHHDFGRHGELHESLISGNGRGPDALSFSATAHTGRLRTITVGAGAATQLDADDPASATAQSGVAFAQQPVVQLRDGAGNPVSQAGVTVTAAIATGAARWAGRDRARMAAVWRASPISHQRHGPGTGP